MKLQKTSKSKDKSFKRINSYTLADRMADGEDENTPVQKQKNHTKASLDKKYKIFMIIGVAGLIGGIVCLVLGLVMAPKANNSLGSSQISVESQDNISYSALTGEPLMDGSQKNAPAYCIQTPNGTDGARPQSGLTEAGVIFEAIAEAGITRFAAIYQDPTSAVIGPIRSLRLYYLDWDTPFDCTIVHAGGADNALAAVSSGAYKDLSEDYAYMYRGTYGSRLWNNLFTTSTYLKKFSSDHGYNTSEINGFSRMTPKESAKARADASAKEKLDITKASSADTSEIEADVASINLNLGGWDNFNVHYDYDVNTNTYNRSYASGAAHEVYRCPAEDLGEKNPEDVCTLTQMSPAVVVAIVVQESKDSDGYHENINTIGAGDAYIFQNGSVIKGSWSKGAKTEQIKFFDESGKETALAPGQTFVTAVPTYGSVDY